MPSPRFFKFLAVEILAVVLIAAYVMIDAKDVYQWWVGETNFVSADPACDLHKSACEVTLSDGSLLRLDIEPKSIPLMKPLHFKVTIPSDLPTIEIKLFATNMNMGFHSFKLYAKQNGLYEGEGMLPTCIVGNMIWQANLIVNTSSKSVGATFYFQTDK